MHCDSSPFGSATADACGGLTDSERNDLLERADALLEGLQGLKRSHSHLPSSPPEDPDYPTSDLLNSDLMYSDPVNSDPVDSDPVNSDWTDLVNRNSSQMLSGRSGSGQGARIRVLRRAPPGPHVSVTSGEGERVYLRIREDGDGGSSGGGGGGGAARRKACSRSWNQKQFLTVPFAELKATVEEEVCVCVCMCVRACVCGSTWNQGWSVF